MLPSSDRIEHAIYAFVDQAGGSDGRWMSWGTLSSQTGNANSIVLLNLLKGLHLENRIVLEKLLSNRGWRTYPDPELNDDEFFSRGDFRILLTAKGRRRYEELTPKVRIQERIDKALELETHRYNDAESLIASTIKGRLSSVSNQFSGSLLKEEVLKIRLDELEALIRERIKQRRNSAAYASELLSAEQIDALKTEIWKMVEDCADRLRSLTPSPGTNSIITLPDNSRGGKDELLRLKTIAQSLLRELQLEQEMAPMIGSSGKRLVFISCGQYTDQERNLGKDLAAIVEELTPCEGYFADNQNSLLGLSQHIFGALNRAAGFIAVMHQRGRVETPSGGHIRGSVWVEQEIAIAAFLAQAQDKLLPTLVYIQKGIEREGVRQQLRLKPVEFETESQILADLREQITRRTFEPGVALPDSR
jgi:hypothetical protein